MTSRADLPARLMLCRVIALCKASIDKQGARLSLMQTQIGRFSRIPWRM